MVFVETERAVRRDEEPYSRTATTPGVRIAKVSAKNIRLLEATLVRVAVAVALLVAVASGGCSSAGASLPWANGADASTGNPGSATTPPSGDNGPSIVLGDGNAPVPCTGTGWRCKVNTSCAAPTTISGTVYDPAGKNPIYNAVVFVPDDASKLPTITPGTHSCNTCDATIGDYVVATQTDAKGSFSLQNVPTGKGVPLAIQIGKWRRVIAVDTTDCATTTAPAASTRLPRNRSEGDMPQMALLTGGLDDLGCFLTSLGLDPNEYSSPQGGGRLDIYQGISAPLGIPLGNGPGLSNGMAPGNCTGTSCPLWSTRQALEAYDIVLLACEGSENNQNKPASAMAAMHDWLGEGGKVFATHFHYTWFKNGPADFQGVATWLGFSLGTGSGNYAIDTSFFKGQVLHDWLGNVGALTGNAIALNGVAASVSTVNTPTLRWVYDTAATPNDVKYLSFGTPIGGVPAADGGSEAARYCGKAVFSDLHAGGAPSGDLPGKCSGADLTAQEKALEFLFFDLSACVTNDFKPPPLPPSSKAQ